MSSQINFKFKQNITNNYAQCESKVLINGLRC